MKMQKGLIGASVWLALAPWLGVANLAAQTNSRLKMDWERFAAQASERTEVTLDGGLLRSVARFLNDDDKDAKDVQKLLAGLQGVYIHSYGFKHEHQYAEADLDSIRKQLKDANWGRIVQSVNHDGGERADPAVARCRRRRAHQSGRVEQGRAGRDRRTTRPSVALHSRSPRRRAGAGRRISACA